MLSDRAQKMKPSATMALNTKAQELTKAGRDIVSLAIGEPDWDTFEFIKIAAKKSLDEGFTKYTPAAGIPDLRSAVVERTKLDLGLSYEPNQCMIGIGAKQVIFNALQVLCNPGDEVIIPAPYWVSYPTMAELADAKPVIPVCPRETNFKLTPDLLKRSLTAKSKVLILNSPNNPTGQVYSEQELRDLAAVLELTGVWVISDDIYDKMIYDGSKIAPNIACVSEKLRGRVLLANSVSKTYSMTGWRIGSLVGDKKVIDACANYQSQSASCGVAFAQKAAVAALRGPQEEVQKAMKELASRRDSAIKILRTVEDLDVVEPLGAFYIFPNISKVFGRKTPAGQVINNSTEFCSSLIDAEGVVTVPGVEFGMEGCLRLTYTLKEERIVEGMKRIKRFVESLR
ncbi:MAG: pyridoxal phosphate-dependent aminotransferase [Oligoflexia bacterium]|nr:pyridoxal phosphate-dependent aminotransferase [Oligoflexia bacterium]